MEQLDVDLITLPFPHLIIRNTFNAKLSGLNHSDNPISLADRELFKYNDRRIKIGNPLLVLNVINQIKNQYPDVPEHMLVENIKI